MRAYLGIDRRFDARVLFGDCSGGVPFAKIGGPNQARQGWIMIWLGRRHGAAIGATVLLSALLTLPAGARQGGWQYRLDSRPPLVNLTTYVISEFALGRQLRIRLSRARRP